MKKFILVSTFLYALAQSATVSGSDDGTGIPHLGLPSLSSLSLKTFAEEATVRYQTFTLDRVSLTFTDNSSSSSSSSSSLDPASDFWQYTQTVSREVGRYYIDRLKVLGTELPQAQETLAKMKSASSPETRLQESTVTRLTLKQTKYQTIQTFLEALPTTLTHVFYLLTINPSLVEVYSYPHYDYSTLNRSEFWNLNFSSPIEDTVRREGAKIDKRIDVKSIRDHANALFSFLSQQNQRLQRKDTEFAHFSERWDEESVRVFETLGVKREIIRQAQIKSSVREIAEFDQKMERIAGPLGQYYNALVKKLEDFQAELKART